MTAGDWTPPDTRPRITTIDAHTEGEPFQATSFGPHAAVIPEVSGTAHITGRHEFLIDPEDELKHGFILR